MPLKTRRREGTHSHGANPWLIGLERLTAFLGGLAGGTRLLSAVRKHEQLERREAAAQSGSRLAFDRRSWRQQDSIAHRTHVSSHQPIFDQPHTRPEKVLIRGRKSTHMRPKIVLIRGSSGLERQLFKSQAVILLLLF